MRKGLAKFWTASVSDMAQRQERTASNSNSQQQYDTVSKALIHQNPEDWLRFSLGIPEAEVIEVLETEQPTVKSNRADSFYTRERPWQRSYCAFGRCKRTIAERYRCRIV